MITRQTWIEIIAKRILDAKRDIPLRVGIDGIDAAGKTCLADEIASHLTEKGHPILRASIDGFHNPRSVRYQRGQFSPEGYYYDSFNDELLVESLLKPLGFQGSRRCRLMAFDFQADGELPVDELEATNAHILIFDGVFLFRPELLPYWDVKIFVEIDFQTSLQRALQRDGYLFGEQEAIIKRYQERYIPGQKIYLEAEKPQLKADIVIDNNDYIQPILTFHRVSSP